MIQIYSQRDWGWWILLHIYQLLLMYILPITFLSFKTIKYGRKCRLMYNTIIFHIHDWIARLIVTGYITYSFIIFLYSTTNTGNPLNRTNLIYYYILFLFSYNHQIHTFGM